MKHTFFFHRVSFSLAREGKKKKGRERIKNCSVSTLTALSLSLYSNLFCWRSASRTERTGNKEKSPFFSLDVKFHFAFTDLFLPRRRPLVDVPGGVQQCPHVRLAPPRDVDHKDA